MIIQNSYWQMCYNYPISYEHFLIKHWRQLHNCISCPVFLKTPVDIHTNLVNTNSAVGCLRNKWCELDQAGIMFMVLFSLTKCAYQLFLIQSQLFSEAFSRCSSPTTDLDGDLLSCLVELVKFGQVCVSSLTLQWCLTLPMAVILKRNTQRLFGHSPAEVSSLWGSVSTVKIRHILFKRDFRWNPHCIIIPMW